MLVFEGHSFVGNTCCLSEAQSRDLAVAAAGAVCVGSFWKHVFNTANQHRLSPAKHNKRSDRATTTAATASTRSAVRGRMMHGHRESFARPPLRRHRTPLEGVAVCDAFSKRLKVRTNKPNKTTNLNWGGLGARCCSDGTHSVMIGGGLLCCLFTAVVGCRPCSFTEKTKYNCDFGFLWALALPLSHCSAVGSRRLPINVCALHINKPVFAPIYIRHNKYTAVSVRAGASSSGIDRRALWADPTRD